MRSSKINGKRLSWRQLRTRCNEFYCGSPILRSGPKLVLVVPFANNSTRYRSLLANCANLVRTVVATSNIKDSPAARRGQALACFCIPRRGSSQRVCRPGICIQNEHTLDDISLMVGCQMGDRKVSSVRPLTNAPADPHTRAITHQSVWDGRAKMSWCEHHPTWTNLPLPQGVRPNNLMRR